MEGEPLEAAAARKLIRNILSAEQVVFSKHAEQEMDKDGLTRMDVANVLRGGLVKPPEWERGSYRYRVETRKIAVVVAFQSRTELRVVTTWRFRQ